jgi:hypothetical protein
VCAIIPDLQGNGTEESDMDATDEIEVNAILDSCSKLHPKFCRYSCQTHFNPLKHNG